VYAKTGIQFMDFNTLFQLHTLRRNGAKVIDSADKILWMPDAVAYMLTGNAVTEYTVASTSEMLNPATGDLDEELLDSVGLSRSKFGPIVQPGHIIGAILRQVQEATGLGEIPVIAVAGHDTASAVIGVPTPDTDYAYLSCGTWSLLGIESPEAIINDKSFGYNFTNEGGIDGTTR
ncbi:FGGY family carbohydrate kinase, partial [Duncaniella muris]|uniref:FGGY family carbohydrate kinase n=1 Tax=Duncaniella muris TaxID=2094150 RepID=UPI0025B00F60